MKKSAIVTGSSRGIGAATASLLAANGYNVVINYNTSSEAAKALCSKLLREGHEAVIFGADVSIPSEARELCRFAADTYGRIDLAVCNAGVSLFSLASETGDEQWQHVFDVNVKGVFNVCREAIADMLKRKSGSIVTISSMWGVCGASCESAYSASKAAVIGLTKSLAKELGPSGISVNCVAPGLIDTDMNSGLSASDIAAIIEETPLLRLGKPLDVAEAVLFLAQSRFITGQVLGVNGGLVI